MREKPKEAPPPTDDADGIVIRAPIRREFSEILTPVALRFVAELARKFDTRRMELLELRKSRQREFDQGRDPDFLPETRKIREADWKVASIPEDLLDRRVEITGPVDRKMIINALNSGAKVYMADFEDSHSPTWDATIQGQINLCDAVNRQITYASPEGKNYRLADKVATLMVRPRGWHLPEKHVLLDGKPVSGSLFDFGLFFFHNAHNQLRRGTGPYFYLPKLESHLEARLWNDVFVHAQDKLDIPRGTIRATVLVETIPAAFEMEEILYELREHSSGLNCGRWDYIFSFIKKFRNRKDRVLPDRAQVTMDRSFLKAYVELLVKICHRRGAHAMGGMAAQIPIKDDSAANEAALAKVRQDKLREVKAGHDGTWVAHPGLVGVAKEIFDAEMRGPHQIERQKGDVRTSARDLLSVPDGTITEAGLRQNLRVGVRYLESWLRGTGCVPIFHLMEDAATAEISRTQIWQWLRHESRLDDGRAITRELVEETFQDELSRIREAAGAAAYESGKYDLAAQLFSELVTRPQCPDFMTLAAYEHLD